MGENQPIPKDIDPTNYSIQKLSKQDTRLRLEKGESRRTAISKTF
jgi:hypothetical protein